MAGEAAGVDGGRDEGGAVRFAQAHLHAAQLLPFRERRALHHVFGIPPVLHAGADRAGRIRERPARARVRLRRQRIFLREDAEMPRTPRNRVFRDSPRRGGGAAHTGAGTAVRRDRKRPHRPARRNPAGAGACRALRFASFQERIHRRDFQGVHGIALHVHHRRDLFGDGRRFHSGVRRPPHRVAGGDLRRRPRRIPSRHRRAHRDLAFQHPRHAVQGRDHRIRQRLRTQNRRRQSQAGPRQDARNRLQDEPRAA